MRRLKRIGLTIVMVACATALVACGKKDELVLVTTESTVSTTEATTEVTTEATTEELTEMEKRITYQDMYDANKGDVLLSGGENYSMNTIYYANGEETFSEYQFLGFDSKGMYAQVYEDSDGYVKVLDAANNYWYQIKDNQLSILLYPEPLVAAAIVDSNHNSMVFGLSGGADSTEVVEEVYKQDGMLMVKTVYSGASGEKYFMEYTLDDGFKVQKFDCYNQAGEKLSYSFVTAGASYDIPEDITEAMAMEQGYRTISITYVDGDQFDMPYYTPLNVPVEISTLEYEAYSNEACTVPWSEVAPDEAGVYKDVTIYMKKNTKEGE
ncbi:MAG: hypothetical protein E7257_04845 [Lachnospiraceae bacterium]|nr:hypothetical protein [Lachnospiraceae bacterium]